MASSGLEYVGLAELRRMAVEHGIKREGVGWPSCCPPSGNKTDIIKAITEHDHQGAGQAAVRGAAERETHEAGKAGQVPPAVGHAAEDVACGSMSD